MKSAAPATRRAAVNALLTELGIAQRDVGQAVVQQDQFLRHVADAAPPSTHVDVGERHAVDGPCPVGPIEPRQQVDHVVLPVPDGPRTAVMPPAATSSVASHHRPGRPAWATLTASRRAPARTSARGSPARARARPARAGCARPATQRALLGDQQLVLALGLVQVVEGLEAQEQQHEGALDRDLCVVHPRDQPEQQQRADDRLLERHHRLFGEDALAQRLVQASRVLLQDGGHQPLAAHRLEQLHALEHVGQTREQRAQREGLQASGAAGHAHQEAEDHHRHQPGQGGERGRLPRHRERQRGVERRLHRVGSDQREVVKGERSPVRFGGHGIGRRAHGLPGVVGPARREQRTQQVQAQIGGRPGDRVADPAFREQDQRALQPEGDRPPPSTSEPRVGSMPTRRKLASTAGLEAGRRVAGGAGLLEGEAQHRDQGREPDSLGGRGQQQAMPASAPTATDRSSGSSGPARMDLRTRGVATTGTRGSRWAAHRGRRAHASRAARPEEPPDLREQPSTRTDGRSSESQDRPDFQA